MNSPANLSPSLREALRSVAEHLFGPGDELLLSIAEQGNDALHDLPNSTRTSLLAEPFATRLAVMRDALSSAKAGPDDDGPCGGATEKLRDIIRQSSIGARIPLAIDAMPRPWEVRVVEAVDLNDSSSPRRATAPLVVVLRALQPLDDDASPDGVDVSAGPRVWSGWTVSKFVEFAGWHDVLLQGEDVPEACAMVQIGNLIQIAEPHLGPSIFSLNNLQKAQVEAVWREFLRQSTPGDLPQDGASGIPVDAVGYVYSRLVEGQLEVVTGTPDVGPLDPRVLFRRMTERAGQAVCQACLAHLDHHFDAESEAQRLIARCRMPILGTLATPTESPWEALEAGVGVRGAEGTETDHTRRWISSVRWVPTHSQVEVSWGPGADTLEQPPGLEVVGRTSAGETRPIKAGYVFPNSITFISIDRDDLAAIGTLAGQFIDADLTEVGGTLVLRIVFGAEGP